MHPLEEADATHHKVSGKPYDPELVIKRINETDGFEACINDDGEIDAKPLSR